MTKLWIVKLDGSMFEVAEAFYQNGYIEYRYLLKDNVYSGDWFSLPSSEVLEIRRGSENPISDYRS